jgi:hypothetical protein
MNQLIVFLVQMKSLFRLPCRIYYQPKLLVRCPTNKSLFGCTYTFPRCRLSHENERKKKEKEKINALNKNAYDNTQEQLIIIHQISHNRFPFHMDICSVCY